MSQRPILHKNKYTRCPSMIQQCTFDGIVLRALCSEEKYDDDHRRNVGCVENPVVSQAHVI